MVSVLYVSICIFDLSAFFSYDKEKVKKGSKDYGSKTGILLLGRLWTQTAGWAPYDCSERIFTQGEVNGEYR